LNHGHLLALFLELWNFYMETGDINDSKVEFVDTDDFGSKAPTIAGEGNEKFWVGILTSLHEP
jgi:hypothetical protein